jgi:hypothetical protein
MGWSIYVHRNDSSFTGIRLCRLQLTNLFLERAGRLTPLIAKEKALERVLECLSV